MARSAKNRRSKFDADPPAMQRIMARARRGARAMGAAEKGRLSAQSPDASRAFSLRHSLAFRFKSADALKIRIEEIFQCDGALKRALSSVFQKIA